MAGDEHDFSLTIDGETHDLDVEDMELWEIEVIEDAAGLSLGELDPNRASVLRALAYIVMRRENPRFTMDEARHLKLSRFGQREEHAENGAAPKPAPRKRPTAAAKQAATTPTDA